MLGKDNIIRTSVSEAVEKIPSDEKDYRKAPLCVLLCTATIYKEQTNITNGRNSCLPTRIHPVNLKKSLKTFYIKLTRKTVQ